MMASVSVIIPCYRSSGTVRRAVDSVAKQTLRPAEVILVDDGSGDDTLRVLQQLQDDYGKDWIKVIALEKNCGVSVARNVAWDIASHDYIAFLDSDDAWHPEKIARQYAWMVKHPEIMLSGHHSLVNKPDVRLNHETISENIEANFISKNKLLFSNVFCTSSVMMKRSIKERFCPSLKYCQDYLLWLEIVLNGNQSAVLNFRATYSFKSPFGESGLTKNLLNLKADISDIYRRLWKSGYINLFEWSILSIWSLAKHYRRVYICHQDKQILST
ncbi:glycosyltransferase family 2 protein [Fischerella sp. PCC 9605]|uniref:glycosyltransferase family 2 protein n=1 Tax=Fischerella sp. PCC 9605 TaxID=1173024 RepID=UPI00047EF6C5|nr:glycosyltransferase family 2 protein [Fischerella sp. PCC 9605]